jgi:hypothetical protein
MQAALARPLVKAMVMTTTMIARTTGARYAARARSVPAMAERLASVKSTPGLL